VNAALTSRRSRWCAGPSTFEQHRAEPVEERPGGDTPGGQRIQAAVPQAAVPQQRDAVLVVQHRQSDRRPRPPGGVGSGPDLGRVDPERGTEDIEEGDVALA
jgi:hypothetical protein